MTTSQGMGMEHSLFVYVMVEMSTWSVYMFLHSCGLNEDRIKCIDKLNTEFSIMYGYNLFYMM